MYWVNIMVLVTIILPSVLGQVALPQVRILQSGCQADNVLACRMTCQQQYRDDRRSLCPCYSKLSECLVQIGCNMKQKTDIFAFCTRKGYCKDGYCNYRAGDLSPRVDKRVEVFELTSVKAPGPCLDRCCPVDCAQNSTLAAVWESSRTYRTDEMKLPPRLGDPRLGVNQAYDRMPYTIGR